MKGHENHLKKDTFRIVLIGVEFEENLSLRYLAGSLAQAGFRNVVVQPYNSLAEAEEICTRLAAEQYHLVGISMAFQVRAIEDMALVQLLRRRGFKNHIAAGGQFATLHYNEIFKDCPGLDSIIRFEGESSIVLLAESLLAATEPFSIPGLVWKDNNRDLQVNNNIPPPSDIDELAWPLRSNDRPAFLGLKSAHMVGSRGCHATCKYCCVATLAAERRAASKDAGAAVAIPGTRRRTAANVAAEMAYLYFTHEVQIFEFQDDNWIPPRPEQAIAYFQELKHELDRNGLGQIGLTLKTRADAVLPATIQLLKEIGLIRVFVGIESGTQTLLSKLGRKSRDNVSLQALQTLREHRVQAYFNALLFGPDIRFDELEPELQFLEQCTDFPFEIVEVVIYGKTGLHASLKSDDRLKGNYLDYEYDYLDAKTQDTHTLITKLDTRHFGVYSPVKMAADLGFNLGLMQVFHPGLYTDELAEKVRHLTERINQDQIKVIRKAAHISSSDSSPEDAVEELIADTVSADLCFYSELIALQKDIELYATQVCAVPATSSYYRAGAVVQSGLVAALLLIVNQSALSQSPGSLDQQVHKQLVDLVFHPNHRKEKQLRKQLMMERTPVLPYLFLLNTAVDSIMSVHPDLGNEQNRQRLTGLRKDLSQISDKRLRNDYRRLKQVLHESNPKIRVVSSLVFHTDKNGKVMDVSLYGPKEYERISPELRAVVLKILEEHQFYAYESRDSYLWKKRKKILRKMKWRVKRMRRGPLD